MLACQHIHSLYADVGSQRVQSGGEGTITASYVQHVRIGRKQLGEMFCQHGHTAMVDKTAVYPAEQGHRRFIPRTLRKKLDSTV
jgi:hypothetical protein